MTEYGSGGAFEFCDECTLATDNQLQLTCNCPELEVQDGTGLNPTSIDLGTSRTPRPLFPALMTVLDGNINSPGVFTKATDGILNCDPFE